MSFPLRPKILVVDDEAGFRELCTDLLGEEGYETSSATQGREAMDALAKDPGAFHLVLSDINMPVMDGLEFLRAAKEAHPHVEIRIADPATGATLERGATGEFCTRGYSVMRGYWNDEERSAEAIDTDPNALGYRLDNLGTGRLQIGECLI